MDHALPRQLAGLRPQAQGLSTEVLTSISRHSDTYNLEFRLGECSHDDKALDYENPESSISSFREWFKHRWTRQELIAPKSVVFLLQGWKVVGTKYDLAHTIEDITGVDAAALLTVLSARRMSVAMRMSWAAGRETRREEDKAYLLLGLFCINMLAVCGEGKQAFIRRLQHEIMSRLSDHTIFAWNGADKGPESGGVLAPSPDSFRRWSNTVHPVSYAEYVERCRIPDSVPELFVTSYGIRMRLLAYMGDAYRATARTVTINEFEKLYSDDNDEGINCLFEFP